MHIVLTNDDGIQAPGLRALHRALLKAGHTVSTIAPVTEQSAVGHALTISLPLRVKEIIEPDFQGFGVFGTPVDCIKLGLSQLVKQKPDMVLSGINAGANVGPDILYSGTVAAASEAARQGFPAMAVSYDSFVRRDISAHAEFTAQLLERIPWSRIPRGRALNLNFPDRPVSETKGLALCPQTSANWNDWYVEGHDPRGASHWWLDGVLPAEQVEPKSDRAMLNNGYISLTPLKFEFTDEQTLRALSDTFFQNL